MFFVCLVHNSQLTTYRAKLRSLIHQYVFGHNGRDGKIHMTMGKRRKKPQLCHRVNKNRDYVLHGDFCPFIRSGSSNSSFHILLLCTCFNKKKYSRSVVCCDAYTAVCHQCIVKKSTTHHSHSHGNNNNNNNKYAWRFVCSINSHTRTRTRTRT